MMNKEVKLCGTRSILDLDVAMEVGADAIGVICGRERISRHTVDTHRAGWIIRNTPDDMTSVLVPRLTDPVELVELAKRINPDRVQLGEVEDPRLPEALSAMTDRPQIAQVFHIGDGTTSGDMDDFLDYIDIAHFDTRDKDRPGGTGKTHDWEISREMTDAAHEAGKLALLAGGLTPENVGQAVRVVQPDGIDGESYFKDEFGAHVFVRAQMLVTKAREAFGALEMVG